MNRHILQKEIVADEGMVLHVYKDHLGYPTVGCGHLITEKDEEFNKPEGYKISSDRANTLFATDLENAIDDCRKLYTGFEILPEEVQHIIVNMMFNLGRPRLSGFKKMNAALASGDLETAAIEGRDSRWYVQVGDRAERWMTRLEVCSKH